MADKIAAERLELEKRALDDKESRNREYLHEKTNVHLEDLSSDEEDRSETSSNRQKRVERVEDWVIQANSSEHVSNAELAKTIVTDKVHETPKSAHHSLPAQYVRIPEPSGHQAPGNSTSMYQPTGNQTVSGNLQVNYTTYGIQQLSQPSIAYLAAGTLPVSDFLLSVH